MKIITRKEFLLRYRIPLKAKLFHKTSKRLVCAIVKSIDTLRAFNKAIS